MAKELPYYKFEPAEWENGTVADCSLAAQGLFIRICNLYWQRQGLLSIDQFSKRFKQQKLIKELKNTSVLKEDGNKIKINFLDNQLAEFYDKSKKASESANKRWEESHTERNANVMRTHSEGNAIREEKRREEDNIYVEFISFLNGKTGKSFKDKTTKYKTAFNARIKEGWTLDQMKLAVESAVSDQYHIETMLKYITPEFMLRPDKLDKFANRNNSQAPHPYNEQQVREIRDWLIKYGQVPIWVEEKYKPQFTYEKMVGSISRRNDD